MHTGARPYHPGNRRVVLRVAARDLQARYGLSDAALQHVLWVRLRPLQGQMLECLADFRQLASTLAHCVCIPAPSCCRTICASASMSLAVSAARTVYVIRRNACGAGVQVAGPRYNARTGILKLACDWHRMREDNRRQALHWALQLVEAALLEHPSEGWAEAQARQAALLATLPPGGESAAITYAPRREAPP